MPYMRTWIIFVFFVEFQLKNLDCQIQMNINPKDCAYEEDFSPHVGNVLHVADVESSASSIAREL